MMEALQAECRQRLGRPRDPKQVLYSKFYPAFGAWHHIYGIPLYSAEELLVVENLMENANYGGMRFDNYVAGFQPADHGSHGEEIKVLSWQLLLWNPAKEVYVLGNDEGPRSLTYTSFE